MRLLAFAVTTAFTVSIAGAAPLGASSQSHRLLARSGGETGLAFEGLEAAAGAVGKTTEAAAAAAEDTIEQLKLPELSTPEAEFPVGEESVVPSNDESLLEKDLKSSEDKDVNLDNEDNSAYDDALEPAEVTEARSKFGQWLDKLSPAEKKRYMIAGGVGVAVLVLGSAGYYVVHERYEKLVEDWHKVHPGTPYPQSFWEYLTSTSGDIVPDENESKPATTTSAAAEPSSTKAKSD